MLGNYIDEYKNKVGGETLGEVYAAKESRLGSPQEGVPIREDKKGSREIIRQMEKMIGLRSWIDNV